MNSIQERWKVVYNLSAVMFHQKHYVKFIYQHTAWYSVLTIFKLSRAPMLTVTLSLISHSDTNIHEFVHAFTYVHTILVLLLLCDVIQHTVTWYVALYNNYLSYIALLPWWSLEYLVFVVYSIIMSNILNDQVPLGLFPNSSHHYTYNTY